jgi:hypothetical protein
VFFASFTYQAQSWSKPRRVVAKVEWHQGEPLVRAALLIRLAGSAMRRSARGA